tara:strand:- start:6433 stop:7305 length:873 start_codon:yes stop_codon:yes gene_type:complete
MYKTDDFTYGMEIEWGDVPRTIAIPNYFGQWEYSERDIINLVEPYKNVCADPLGIEPKFGGEINTTPTRTWHEQVVRYFQLEDYFKKLSYQPTVSATCHTHIHCRVPFLKDDIKSLKKLIGYIKENQHTAIQCAYGFHELEEMSLVKGAKRYLKWDGGRPMPDYMCNNIMELSHDFDSFIKLHAAGKDGVSMGRPFRYAINTYCLKHLDTIEFRLFRGTLVQSQLESCFRFVHDFINAALNDGDSVADLILKNNYNFPPMIWSRSQLEGWKQTKYDDKRGKKVRTYVEVI